jgi:hypothetical protein
METSLWFETAWFETAWRETALICPDDIIDLAIRQ